MQVTKSGSEWKIGDKVLANDPSWLGYYTGTIIDINKDKTQFKIKWGKPFANSPNTWVEELFEKTSENQAWAKAENKRLSQESRKKSGEKRKQGSRTKSPKPAKEEAPAKRQAVDPFAELPKGREPIKVPIPFRIRQQIVEEWESIARDQRVLSLPRPKSVNQLLDGFINSRTKKKDSAVKEVAEGLRIYFRYALPVLLLFNFERPQYEDATKGKLEDYKPQVASPQEIDKATRFEPSQSGAQAVDVCDIYGLEHFVRIFVKLPQILAFLSLQKAESKLLRVYFKELLAYLVRQADDCLSKEDYIKPSDKYLQRVDELVLQQESSAILEDTEGGAPKSQYKEGELQSPRRRRGRKPSSQ